MKRANAMKSQIVFFLAILLMIAILTGCAKSAPEKPFETPAQENPEQEAPPEPQNALPQPEAMPPLPLESEKAEIKQEQKAKAPAWKEGSVAIAGKYADADVIDLGNGKYRMYYSAEPEVQGFKGQAYSAISSDGISWAQENGIRMEWAIFPSVIKLPNSKYRMYFQSQGAIKSAISSDGLSWKEEPGIRIDIKNNEGLNLENVAAPTVMKIGDEYVMVYRGTINERYPERVPNNNIQLFLWAASGDGLNFEKKGIALDSRNDMFKGLLDGPELVEWDGSSIRVYFWSYKGIFHSTFEDGAFSQPEFDYTNADPMMEFPQNPPSDPTLAKINGKWLMYYGQHTQGIYYATLEG